MLNIKLENLGNIKEANIHLSKLTLFLGENNSGKTYLNYVLYALLNKRFISKNNFYDEFIKDAKENGVLVINYENFLDENYEKLKHNLEKSFAKNLDRFFSAEEGTFDAFKLTLFEDIKEIKQNLYKVSFSNELIIGKNKIICEIIKEKDTNIITLIMKDITLPNDLYNDFISDVFFKYIFYNMNNDTFLLPAERTGLNLFYQELNNYRNSLINNLQKSKINPMDVLKDMMFSKYPQPIADYIDFLNNTSALKKKKSSFRDLNEKMRHKILKGN